MTKGDGYTVPLLQRQLVAQEDCPAPQLAPTTICHQAFPVSCSAQSSGLWGLEVSDINLDLANVRGQSIFRASRINETIPLTIIYTFAACCFLVGF